LFLQCLWHPVCAIVFTKEIYLFEQLLFLEATMMKLLAIILTLLGFIEMVSLSLIVVGITVP
jgi:hypothetical protein